MSSPPPPPPPSAEIAGPVASANDIAAAEAAVLLDDNREDAVVNIEDIIIPYEGEDEVSRGQWSPIEEEADDEDDQERESDDDDGTPGLLDNLVRMKHEGAEVKTAPAAGMDQCSDPSAAAAAAASCSICMEPWTSNGAHRICCVPCGHVYGRSCLQKWLRRGGGYETECPQCRESFEQDQIVNLYSTTNNLWNHCKHKKLLEDLSCQLEATEKKLAETWKRLDDKLSQTLEKVMAYVKAFTREQLLLLGDRQQAAAEPRPSHKRRRSSG